MLTKRAALIMILFTFLIIGPMEVLQLLKFNEIMQIVQITLE